MSGQYALKQAEKRIRVVAKRLTPYVHGHPGSSIWLLMGFAARTGEIAYIAYIENGAGEAYNAAGEIDATTRRIYEAVAETLGGGTAVRAPGPLPTRRPRRASSW